MPRPVVPIAPPRRDSSRALSSATCQSRITWQRPETRRRAGSRSTPRSRSFSISASSTRGSTTTPGPIRFTVPGRRMPAGTTCSTVASPSTTSVWPALFPPWKRTTRSARMASQSTILPLPSSPHWAPTATSVATVPLLQLDQRRRDHVRQVAQPLQHRLRRARVHVHEHRRLVPLAHQRELHARDVDARLAEDAPHVPHHAPPVVVLDQDGGALRDRLEHEVVDAHDARLPAVEDGARDEPVHAAAHARGDGAREVPGPAGLGLDHLDAPLLRHVRRAHPVHP